MKKRISECAEFFGESDCEHDPTLSIERFFDFGPHTTPQKMRRDQGGRVVLFSGFGTAKCRFSGSGKKKKKKYKST